MAERRYFSPLHFWQRDCTKDSEIALRIMTPVQDWRKLTAPRVDRGGVFPSLRLATARHSLRWRDNMPDFKTKPSYRPTTLLGICHHPHIVPRKVSTATHMCALLGLVRPVRCAGCSRPMYRNIVTGHLSPQSTVHKRLLLGLAVLAYGIFGALYLFLSK